MGNARLLVITLAASGDAGDWVAEYTQSPLEVVAVREHDVEADVRQAVANRSGQMRAMVAIDQRFMGFLAKRASDTLLALGLEMPTLVHPAASVSRSASLGAGVRVAAGAIVASGCSLGEHTRVLERVVLSRGSRVGAHSTFDPGVLLGENSRVGDHCWLRAGLVLEPNTVVGSSCELGPGGVVRGEVAEGTLAVSQLDQPARIYRFG